MGGRNARLAMAHGARLVGFASAYPKRSVSNSEFLELVSFEPSDGWARIAAESGISVRRWCGVDESAATLMSEALVAVAARYPRELAEVDVVIVASGTTMPVVQPVSSSNPAAADLAPLALRQLGLGQALGLDIKACYCTGFLRGLEVADGLLANPNRRAVLVIAVEQGSRLATADTNRSSFCFMVGDSAGAAILRRASEGEGTGILDHCGYTDPEKYDWVGIGPDARSIIMMGSQAAEASLAAFVECGRLLLRRNSLSPAEVQWLLPLQTHRGLVSQIATALEWPEDRILWGASELGFAGSSSIPACLADEIHRGTIRSGDLVLALAVGAGLNCAGTLLRV